MKEKKRRLMRRDNVKCRVRLRIKKIPEIITILFLASNPIDTPSLRLDAKSRAIQEVIRKSDYRDTIRFENRGKC